MKRAALFVSALCLTILFGTISSQAGQTEAATRPKSSAMRILIVRSAAGDCEPDCAEWISAEGDITAATPALLRKVLKAIGGRKLPLILTSPGGDVAAGYAMGRLIRRAGLEVTIGRTVLAPCKPEEKNCTDSRTRGRRGFANNVGAFCNSACVFALAGGVARHVFWVSPVGVHQFASSRTLTRWRQTTLNGRVIRREILSVSRIEVKTSKAQYDQAARYFDEMGIDPSINELVQLASNSTIHIMNRRELLATKIITDGQDANGQVLKLQATLFVQKNADRLAAFTATSTDVPAGLYDGSAIISHIELREAPDAAGVQASITPTTGSGPVPIANLIAILRIADIVAFSNLSQNSPSPPLTINLDPVTFCALADRRTLTFTIGPKASNPVKVETVTVSTRRFRDLDLLLAKVCSKRDAPGKAT